MNIKDEKVIPDYTGDKYFAKQLADRIMEYYHNMGQKQVKAWVESISRGDNGHKIYAIRSNLVFNCNALATKI